MLDFLKETDRIYRLKIPFDTVYTSVFLITSEKNTVLVDCATTEDDVKSYILPALKRLGYELSDITELVITHRHGDHAGGLDSILALAPEIKVVTNVCQICDGIMTYPLAGHTKDCVGVLDEYSGTLITGDGIQGAGVDKYRCSLDAPNDYLQTLKRIKSDKRISCLLFSHAYEPWNKDCIIGRENVKASLMECVKYID